MLLCDSYYDIRTFGAVIATKGKQDQVRGPVQMTFARSIEPITQMEHSITRMAVTREEDVAKEKTMGRKNTVPYGLYLCHGFVSANLARQTGFSEEDLQLFWDALKNMFDQDRSAARGLMSAQNLSFSNIIPYSETHLQTSYSTLCVSSARLRKLPEISLTMP